MATAAIVARFAELSKSWRACDLRARTERLRLIDALLDEHNAGVQRDVARRAGLL